jgi:hypothetical protein
MSSYLTGGTSQPAEEKTSNMKIFTLLCNEIKYDVPQGSVLETLLLLLLFINDLPQAKLVLSSFFD